MSHGESGSWRPARMAGRERQRVLVILLVAVAHFLLHTPTPVYAAANPTPVLAIRLDAPGQSARVTEGEIGIVTFTGRMSIDKLPVEYCVVTLNASTDTGWVSLVSPTTAVFTNTTPQPFTCIVIVPQGTPNNLSGNIFILGRAVAGGLWSTAGTRGIVSVEPYFRVDVYAKQPVLEISPGGQAFFTYFVRNDGNGIDSFSKEVSNLKELADRGWTAVMCACMFTKVPPGEYKPDRLTLASPRDEPFMADYSISIIVKVTSCKAPDFSLVVSDYVVLTVHVKGDRLPGLSPCLLILALSLAAGYLLRPRKGP